MSITGVRPDVRSIDHEDVGVTGALYIIERSPPMCVPAAHAEAGGAKRFIEGEAPMSATA